MSKLSDAKSWFVSAAVDEAKKYAHELGEQFTGADAAKLRKEASADAERFNPDELIALYESSTKAGRHH